MNIITIPKKIYQELIDKSLRYDYLQQILREDIFSVPPIKNQKKILQTFRATKKYNQKFLTSLEKGLKRSTYFKS